MFCTVEQGGAREEGVCTCGEVEVFRDSSTAPLRASAQNYGLIGEASLRSRMLDLCVRRRLVRGPGLVGGVAEMLEAAVGAFRFAGYADLAAVVDYLVGKLNPAVLWEDFH